MWQEHYTCMCKDIYAYECMHIHKDIHIQHFKVESYKTKKLSPLKFNSGKGYCHNIAHSSFIGPLLFHIDMS